MGESEALPDVLDDLASTLLRQGFVVTARTAADAFGDQSVEFTHGHRGILFSRDRGRWSVDVRLIDRWFPPTAVESALDGVKRPARPMRPARPAGPPSLEEQALSTLGVIAAMPASASMLRELRDQVSLGLQRRRAPFLGSWGRRAPRR